LTQRGEEKARQLGERLRHLEFTRVFTSPLQRARRTAEQAGLGNQLEVNADLVEWNYGQHEGLTTTEIRRRQPDWNVFLHGCPGGESTEEIARRADRIVGLLRELQGEIAVFSHGHFLRALVVRWLGLPVSEGRHFSLATASWSILGFEHHERDEPAVVLWNALVHAER